VKCKSASAAEAPADPPLAIRTDNLEKKLDAPKTKKRKASVVLDGNELSPRSAFVLVGFKTQLKANVFLRLFRARNASIGRRNVPPTVLDYR